MRKPEANNLILTAWKMSRLGTSWSLEVYVFNGALTLPSVILAGGVKKGELRCWAELGRAVRMCSAPWLGERVAPELRWSAWGAALAV